MQPLRKTIGSARPVKAEGSALEVSGLTVRFGARTILDAINFDVREGEFLCIVGSSGSGKTTLLRVLAGLARPAEGKVLFAGAGISGPSRDRAIIFQDYSKALLPWRTVRGNVALSLESRNVPAAEQGVIVDELLGIMGLSQASEQFPESAFRRHAAARADCPLPGAGSEATADGRTFRRARRDDPAGLAGRDPPTGRRKKIATVFITHDLEEAIYLGDRVIVLGGSPAGIVETIKIDLPRPRNQLTTREDSRFLAYRHRLFEMLVHERARASVPEQRSALMRRLLLGAIIPVSVLGLWEASSRAGLLTLESLSRPSDIVAAGYAGLRDGSLLLATLQTCETALLGLAIAAVVGIAVGTVLGLAPTAEQIAGPTIEALRPIPAIAFMPLALMMFGFGVGLEASIVAYACVWPILIVTITAVRAIEARLLEVAAVLEFRSGSGWRRSSCRRHSRASTSAYVSLPPSHWSSR